MKDITPHLAVAFVAAGFLIIVEAVSVHPAYRMEMATVRKVVADERGFIGADKMTLVRFDDGFDDEVSGDRGEPGERILVHRQRGTESMLGWFARKEP